jgi:transcription elongation GreA/GreB family factor
MKLKQKIYNHYLQVITDKVAMLQKVLNDLKESGANETKSTAGDKHETALAMLQIEQANTRTQLQEVLNQQAAMQKINPSLSADMVLNGSLIKTNRGYFFMSVALGKADVDHISVTALSPQSPLGNRLMGLKAGATAAINNTDYLIESIE